MAGRLDHLQRDEHLVAEVPAEPHRGEVAPAELPDYVVAATVQSVW